jgi:hypothetical protein
MSRGGIWLTAGILCIIASFCAGAMIAQAAFDAMGKEQDFGQTFQRFSKLAPLAMLADLAFYGGIIAAIIGAVLLIVDRGQQSKSLTSFSETDLRHDYAIDVCISHPTENGTRSKHFFTTSKQLVATLVEWKQQGHQDVILTWGKTDEKLVPIIVAQIRRAGGAEYRGPRG